MSDSNPRTPAQALGGATPGENVGPTPRDPPHTPASPDIARARGSTNAALFNALHLAIESSLSLPWSNMDTWAKLRPISQHAQQLGFSVPYWVTVMSKVTTMRLLQFDLNEHSQRHADSTKCDLTHVLRRHSSAVSDPFLKELPHTAVCDKLKDHWRVWAAPIAAQSASISVHLARSSGTLSDALQPPLDPNGVIARAFSSDCLRNYSDVDDLFNPEPAALYSDDGNIVVG